MKVSKLQTKKRTGGYATYEEAEKFVRTLNLKSQYEWHDWYTKNYEKCNIILPKCPSTVYGRYGRTSWKGWGEFLGTFTKQRSNVEYLSFEEAKRWVQDKTNFRTSGEYRKWFITNKEKKPPNIPLNPQKTYKNKGWKGWEDYLGQNYDPINLYLVLGKPKERLIPYTSAKRWASTLGLKSKYQWYVYIRNTKLRPDVPRNPDVVYGDRGTWGGWKDFLGVIPYEQRGKKTFLPFEQVREWARTLKLKNGSEWRAYLREHKSDIPKGIPIQSIERIYLKDWTSWEDFLGCEKQTVRKIRELKDPGMVSVYVYHSGGQSFNTFGVYACKKDAYTMKYYFDEKRLRVAKIYRIKDEYIQDFMNELYKMKPIHSTAKDELILNNPAMTFEYWDEIAEKLNSTNR